MICNLNAAERLDSGRPWGRAHRAQYWCDVPRTSTMGKRRRLVGTVVGLGVILSAMIFALVQRRVQERLREALSRNAARRNALGNFLVLQLPSPRSRRWRNHLRLPDWSCRSPSRAGPSRACNSGYSSPRATRRKMAVSLAAAARPAHVTPCERQRGLEARHVVC